MAVIRDAALKSPSSNNTLMPRGRRGQSRARGSDAPAGMRPRAQQRRISTVASMLPTTAPRRSARISARSSRAEGNDPAPSDLLAPAHQSLSSRAAEAESSRHRRREETRRERSDEETPIASRALIDENQTAPRPSVTGRKLTNGTAGQEFTLRITVEPPTEALVNIPLYPPVTVRLEGETVVDGNEDELGSLWAFASLTNEDGSELLSPPRPDLMTGAFANSFHAITLTDGDTTASAEDRPPQTIAGDQRQDRIVSFASFPGIAIREAGRYSIRVTLFRMEVGAAAPASAQGAASLSQVQSRPIYISDSPAVNSVDAAAQRLLQTLRDQGIAIPHSSA